MTTREWQGRMDVRLDKLEKHFSNHLAHHWAVTISLIGALLTTTGSLLTLIIKYAITK